MQDEYGRPLSDDGQWVWDGSAWRATGVGQPGGPAQDPATTAYDPTAVYDPASAQQPYYQGAAQPPYGTPVPPTPYRGGPPPPPPWYKRPVVIIGALLVLSAVLATILILTLSGDSKATPPAPTPTTSAPTASPTSATPSPTPTTEAPTTPPPTTTPPTTPPPTTPPPATTVSPGLYECTQAGTQFGSISFVGNSYTTSNGGSGTYRYDATTNDLTFTGADLSDFTGIYDPTGPSMVLTSASDVELRCSQ